MQSSLPTETYALRNHDVLGELCSLSNQPTLFYQRFSSYPQTKHDHSDGSPADSNKSFFVSEENRLCFCCWQTMDEFLTASMTFLFRGFGDDLHRNAAKFRHVKITFNDSTIFLVLLVVPGWLSCEQIISLTFLMFSEVRIVLGRPLLGFLTTADPDSSTRLQIALTVFTFHCFYGHFAAITRYPRPCSRNVWIRI